MTETFLSLPVGWPFLSSLKDEPLFSEVQGECGLLMHNSD